MIEQAKHLANTLGVPVESSKVQPVIEALQNAYRAGGGTAMDAVRVFSQNSQSRFEDETWVLHCERAERVGEPTGTRDDLFWKQPDGSYGVLMFNAAWWGWQAALKAVVK